MWHHLSEEQIFKNFQTSQNGLSSYEVASRLQKNGQNCLPEAPPKSALMHFLEQFHNILIYVLIFSGLITGILGHLVDTIFIFAVVIINAIIGFVQEDKAEKAIEGIRKMLSLRANVIRDGKRLTIDCTQLAPGDIVFLEAGDKVPADLRLYVSHGMTVQEAILTGESIPVEKNPKPVPQDSVLGDRANMCFSGTLVTSGQGKGVVVATGPKTEIGKISNLVLETKSLKTSLLIQMGVFAQWLAFIILLISGFILIFCYCFTHQSFEEVFMAVVGLSVAAIPEGLPAVLTITLAVGVKAMAKKHVIVRHLPSIETLGAVSVICTDKTGTLTRNKMSVVSVLTSDSLLVLEEDSLSKQTPNNQDTNLLKDKNHNLKDLALAAAICNDAYLYERDGCYEIQGDPMEGALLSFVERLDLNIRKEQDIWKRTDCLSFDSKNRFMATLNHNNHGNSFIFVKGAPERILQMCSYQDTPNGEKTLLNKPYWDEKSEEIAASGQRVLAFAYKPVPFDQTVLKDQDVEKSLILLGMVGLIDPPRSEVLGAIKECREAGIQIKMITGDHAKTALAIGKQIGLNHDVVMTGEDLDQIDDALLSQHVMKCDIFARTRPDHKLRLVKALQADGLIVAMTGDGVNDAPALKRADAGIAMGKKGSEAAKEASKLVLLDDNFSSIVEAVREGRTVYDNIKKVISWTLPTSAGEALVIIMGLLFGMILPITPVQILWVNLISSATLGMALAFEPSEKNTMQRPPRQKYEPLLDGGLIHHVVLTGFLIFCGVSGVFYYAIYQGLTVELSRTLAVNTLIMMKIFDLFFIRTIYNSSLTWKTLHATKQVWISVLISLFAQAFMTYNRIFQKIFMTESLAFYHILLIFSVGGILFILIEWEKQIRFKKLTNSKISE